MRDPVAVTALFEQAIHRRLCSAAELAAELRVADRRGLGLARRQFVELRDRLAEQANTALAGLVEQAALPDGSGVDARLDTSAWQLSAALAMRERVPFRRSASCTRRVVRVTPERLADSPASVLVELLTTAEEVG